MYVRAFDLAPIWSYIFQTQCQFILECIDKACGFLLHNYIETQNDSYPGFHKMQFTLLYFYDKKIANLMGKAAPGSIIFIIILHLYRHEQHL